MKVGYKVCGLSGLIAVASITSFVGIIYWKTGEIFERMVPDITFTAERLEEIAASSDEQRNGTDLITRAVTQMDNVVQQNASVSEELASTAEELATQANHLQTAIGYFKMDTTQTSRFNPTQIANPTVGRIPPPSLPQKDGYERF